MSRKKVSKVKKILNKTKKQTKAKHSSSLQAMEKEFRHLPAKLIQQIRKESASLKKQESSLNSSLKKTQQQLKAINDKESSLLTKSEEKASPTTKKRLLALRKSNDKLNKNITKWTSDLKQIQNQLFVASEKQIKFISISKEIAQWDKKTKPKSVVTPLSQEETVQQVQEIIDSALSQTTVIVQ